MKAVNQLLNMLLKRLKMTSLKEQEVGVGGRGKKMDHCSSFSNIPNSMII